MRNAGNETSVLGRDRGERSEREREKREKERKENREGEGNRRSPKRQGHKWERKIRPKEPRIQYVTYWRPSIHVFVRYLVH